MAPRTSRILSAHEWLQQIRTDREAHFSEDRIEQWRVAAEYYRSGSCAPDLRKAFFSSLNGDVQELRINVTQAIIENLTALMKPAELRASILPRRPGDRDTAFNVQQLFNNHIIPETELDRVVDDWLLFGLIFGDSFLKIGFIDFKKRSVADVDAEDVLASGEVEIQAGGDFEYPDQARFRQDLPWFQVKFPWNLVPASGAYGLWDTPYIVDKVRRRFSDVVGNPNYEKAVRKTLRPSVDNTDEMTHPYKHEELLTTRGDQGSEDTEQEEYIDLFEIYDLENQQFSVVAHGHTKDFLRGPIALPFPALEGYPYVHFQPKRDPESFYGIPIIKDFADLQEELNTVSSFMLEAYKRSVPFYTYDKNTADEKQIQQAADVGMGGFVGFDGPPSLDSFPKGPAFNPEIFGVRNLIIQAILLVTGQSDFLIGQSQKTKSATEVAATSQAFTGRMQFRQNRFKRSLGELFRKTYQIVSFSMTQERWIRTIGVDANTMIPITAEQLQVMRDIDVDAEIFQDRTSDPVRMKLILDALNPLIQSPALASLAGADFIEIFRQYLRAIGIRDTDRIQPVGAKPRDPQSENIAILDGAELEPHPLDDDVQHIALHIQAQEAAPQGIQIRFQEHIGKHQRNFEQKQRLFAERQQLAAETAAGTGGGAEAPSRQSTSQTQASQQSRINQGSNNQ